MLFACSEAILFKSTNIVGSTARTQYIKLPTTCCTVLASGGAISGYSGDWCANCGAMEP